MKAIVLVLALVGCAGQDNGYSVADKYVCTYEGSGIVTQCLFGSCGQTDYDFYTCVNAATQDICRVSYSVTLVSQDCKGIIHFPEDL